MTPGDPAVVAQFGLGTARLVGGAVVLAIMLGFLYVVLRHGGIDREGVPEESDESTLPSFGPAYGAGGDSVEEVLAGERERGPVPDADGGDDADEAPPEVLDHRIVSRRADELVVEVSGEDRSERFYVEDPDANPTITPASSDGDDDWHVTATDYLRAAVLAGEFESDGDAGW